MSDINTDMDQVRESIKVYNEVEGRIQAFMGAHGDIVETFQQLLDERNTALVESKRLLRIVGSSIDQPRLSVPPFLVTKTRSRGFDVKKLLFSCPAAFNLPGVVKSVDAKVIEAAVGDGRLDASVLQSARAEGNHSIQVRGPQETTLKLG